MKIKLREVCVKYKTRKQGITCTINSPDTAVNCFQKIIEDDSQEQVFVLFLNVANEIIGYSVIGKGSDCESIASPKIIYQKALLCGANSIVIMHNHPSGNVEPSLEDIELTTKLIDAGKLLGINVIDHIIVGYDTFNSIRANQPELF